MLAGLNLFLANVSILYPLETTEKQTCFQVEIGKLVIKAVLTKFTSYVAYELPINSISIFLRWIMLR